MSRPSPCLPLLDTQTQGVTGGSYLQLSGSDLCCIFSLPKHHCRADQGFLHPKGELKNIFPLRMVYFACTCLQGSSSPSAPSPILLLVSKVGQSRNIICSKAQHKQATSELLSSELSSSPQRQVRMGLEKGCPGRAVLAGGWMPEQYLQMPQLPGVKIDASSPSLLLSPSSPDTDTTLLCISPAVSCLESVTQNQAGKPDAGRRAGLPGNGGTCRKGWCRGREGKAAFAIAAGPAARLCPDHASCLLFRTSQGLSALFERKGKERACFPQSQGNGSCALARDGFRMPARVELCL